MPKNIPSIIRSEIKEGKKDNKKTQILSWLTKKTIIQIYELIDKNNINNFVSPFFCCGIGMFSDEWIKTLS